MKKSAINLTGIPYLNSLPEHILKLITAKAKIHQVKLGTKLFQKDEKIDGLYIVKNGFFRAFNDDKDNQVTSLYDLSKNNIIGTREFLLNLPFKYNIIALKDSEIIYISRNIIENLLKKYPAQTLDFLQNIAANFYNKGEKKTRGKVHNIVIYPVHEQIDIKYFEEKLKESLDAKSIYLTRDSISNLVAQKKSKIFKSSDNNEIYNHLEEQYDYIFSQTSDDEKFNRQLVSSADIIILIADNNPTSLPKIKQVFENIRNISPLINIDIIILHPDETILPLSYLGDFSKFFATKFTIALNRKSDFNFLVRQYTGKKTALILGGGGARAFAHIGAIRALKERNYEFDLIVGSDVGAVIAVMLAAGFSYKKMLIGANNIFGNKNLFKDNFLNLTSYFKNSKLESSLNDYFKDQLLENLWRPIAINLTNINSRSAEIFTSGNISKLLHASLALKPGIPAVYINNNSYINAVSTNYLHCDIARKLGADKIIALDVISNLAVKDENDELDKIYINHEYIKTRMINLADEYYNLNLGNIGSDEWEKIAQITDMGYKFFMQD